jgi:hypothetical protein
MMSPIRIFDEMVWYGPSEPDQLFHGSRCKNLPVGEMLLPQARSGVGGWIQNPKSDGKRYLYLSPCSVVSAIYAMGRGFDCQWGGVYKVAIGDGDVLEKDPEAPEFQLRTLRGARIIADMTETLFPWEEFIEPSKRDAVRRMQRAGVAPHLFSGKATLADVQLTGSCVSEATKLGLSVAGLLQGLARNLGERTMQ